MQDPEEETRDLLRSDAPHIDPVEMESSWKHADQEEGGTKSKEESWGSPSFLWICPVVLLDFLAASSIFIPVAQYQNAFYGASRALLISGFCNAGSALVKSFASPLVGSLADRYGRRRYILLTIVTGILPKLLFLSDFVVKDAFWIYDVTNALSTGVGGATFLAFAYVSDVVSPGRRGAAFGIVGSMITIAFGIGPAVGLALKSNVALGAYNAAFLAILVVYVAFMLPESNPRSPSRGGSSGGSETQKYTFWETLSFLFKSARREIQIGCFAAFIFAVGFTVLTQQLLLYFEARFGGTQTPGIICLTIVAITGSIAQGALVRPMIRRLGPRNTAIFGCAMTATMYVVIGIAWAEWIIYIGVTLGCFTALVAPILASILSQATSPTEQGLVQGATAAAKAAADIISPLAFGGIFSACNEAVNKNPDLSQFVKGVPWLVAAIFPALACLVLLRLPFQMVTFDDAHPHGMPDFLASDSDRDRRDRAATSPAAQHSMIDSGGVARSISMPVKRQMQQSLLAT